MGGFESAAIISLAVTVAVFVALIARRDAPPDVLFLGGMVAVTLLGVITPEAALAGFANPAVLTIASLFVVAAGLRSTGVLDWVGHRLLGTARTEASAIRRLALSIVTTSAFMPNTPVVAMMMPVVVDWCRQRRVSPSRLLIPLSYLTILGGVCTLIGTTTTLLINGLLKAAQSPGGPASLRPMELFEIGKVGLPCAIVGTLYLVFFGRRYLPNRTDLLETLGELRREYLVEMLVQPECRLIGKTVEDAGLRHLPGLFLIEIDREGEIITPVTPEDVIHKDDRLVFTGVVTTIVDLEKIPGLVPAADMNYEVVPKKRHGRYLSEAVISHSSPLIGTSIREANFRQLYNAAVVAVHRNGKRLTNKIGDIRLQPGDTLLLQTRTEFVQDYRHSRDFHLVSTIEGSGGRRYDRAWIAGTLFILLVVWLSLSSWLPAESTVLGIPLTGLTSTAVAGIAIAGLMIVFRCLPTAEARGALDLRVIITIAGALAIGRALDESGAAKSIAELLVAQVYTGHPYFHLVVIYVITVIFTELISNTAVAAMMFPLAVAVAQTGGYDARPFIMAVALAASLSFITPIGYQTNLMVMGPGGYRPGDYLRAGIPLAVLMAITSLILIPIVWPF